MFRGYRGRAPPCSWRRRRSYRRVGAHACSPACVCLLHRSCQRPRMINGCLPRSGATDGTPPPQPGPAATPSFTFPSPPRHRRVFTPACSSQSRGTLLFFPFLCICRLVKTGRRRGELTFHWECWGGGGVGGGRKCSRANVQLFPSEGTKKKRGANP